MNPIRLVGGLDPCFGWTGSELLATCLATPLSPRSLRGVYACVSIDRKAARLVRDPMGLGKLFWAVDADGGLLFSARPWRLVEAGCAFQEIRAVPPGMMIEIDVERGGERVESIPGPRRMSAEVDGGRSVETIADEIRVLLDRYCAALAGARPHARVFVCLSGGLDSSGVAVLARRHFRDVTAVSFDLRRLDGSTSADRRTADRLAANLGLPLLTVTPTGDELLDGLDTVLREGIDWRDFNVHAGLVNLALAAGIASASPTSDALVLTGDYPNEYLVDYHAEVWEGQTYYTLPKLPPATLQAALVRGLETSHREVGPFEAWHLPVVQVYAPAVDHYLAVPPSFLADPQRKVHLCRMMFGNAIPDYVYTRPKTRAQIGDPHGDAGVLGLCQARGVDTAALRRRFAALHGLDDTAPLGRFIRGGHYVASVPRLAGVS